MSRLGDATQGTDGPRRGAPPASFLRKVRILAEMIKIEHTLFALPFAAMGAFLAAEGLPDGRTCFWILVAMVGGRTAAMTFNRIADAEIDGRNPRTRTRALPRGIVQRAEAGLFALAAAALFLLAAAMLNRLCILLAGPVLAVLLLYSYTKRFTALSHLVLGLCLGFTPLAGWIAVRGAFHLVPALLGAGVVFWTAGFDVIYACQDVEVDRREGLRSIPARFGVPGALTLSAVFHVLAAGLFLAAGLAARLAWPYWTALGLAGGALLYQHLIVKPGDLSRVNTAFFTANGFVSMVLAAGTYLALVV